MARSHWNDPPNPRWFQDPEFQRALELVLLAAGHRAADVGEALSTAARVDDGDPDSWVHEWLAQAGEVWAAARAADSAGHTYSARAHDRRASTYYATALEQIHRTSEPDRAAQIRARHDECWERSRDGALALPNGRLYLGGNGRRAVLLVHTGTPLDSNAHTRTGAAAIERGYHWATTEHELAATVDALAGHPRVATVAAIGLGAGSRAVAALLAAETAHVRAAVLVPPISAAWTVPVFSPRPGIVASVAVAEAAMFDWLEPRLASARAGGSR
jgi:hypothetical protein